MLKISKRWKIIPVLCLILVVMLFSGCGILTTAYRRSSFTGEWIIIETKALSTAIVGKPYSAYLQAKGGKPPYQWKIVDGTLPDGLLLEKGRGYINGTPFKIEKTQFIIEVRDSSNSPRGVIWQTFSIVVTNP